MSVAGIAAAFGVVHVALERALLPRVIPGISRLSRSAASDVVVQIMWLIGATPIPFLYAHALPALSGSVSQRWHGTMQAVHWAMVLHLGSTVYEMGVYLVYGKSWVYTAHHLIVLYAYGLAIHYGTMHFWGAWDGLTELTNIFICILKLCLLLDRGRGTVLEVVNGSLLYVTYVACRLVSLPCWLALFAHDLYSHPELTWRAGGAHEIAHKLMCMSFPVCTLAVWLLSCAWFVQIHRGMMKALRGVDPLAGDSGATNGRVEKLLGNGSEAQRRTTRHSKKSARGDERRE